MTQTLPVRSIREVRALEARCPHDMLCWPPLGLTSCAVCKGLPYDVRSPATDDQPFAEELLADTVDTETPVRVEVGFDTECASCGEPLKRGKTAAWSATMGLLCPECAGRQP